MSNIVVVLQSSEVEAPVLFELQKVLGRSIASVKETIEGRIPIVETEIFDHKYEEKALLLRGLIELIRKRELSVDVFELPYGDRFESSGALERSRIDVDFLEGILDLADEESERQLDEEF